MLHIVLDIYPQENAFAAHILGPSLEDLRPESVITRQLEWVETETICKRLRKHLRRVGMTDRSHLAESVKPPAKRLSKLHLVDDEAASG